jgi:hypothetical protein
VNVCAGAVYHVTQLHADAADSMHVGCSWAGIVCHAIQRLAPLCAVWRELLPLLLRSSQRGRMAPDAMVQVLFAGAVHLNAPAAAAAATAVPALQHAGIS